METSIYDLAPPQVHQLLQSLGEPAYRARQVLRWVYQRGAESFDEMTDLPKELRERLAPLITLKTLLPLTEQTSPPEAEDTSKVLFRLADGTTIEAVLMVYQPPKGRPRRTVCISSQAGCPFGCLFCATGQQGFERNLSPGEMVEQVLYFARPNLRGAKEAPADVRPPITNVVFMGMGEPLNNYQAVWQAIETMNSRETMGLGARHITVSTVGLAPQIRRLSQEKLQVGLAISLHAPNDYLRDSLVPINRRYPLKELMNACREYVALTKRRISFEYVLFERVNDGVWHAQELALLVRGMNCHVNLIPVNPTEGATFKPPSGERLRAFQRELNRHSVPNTLRDTRGVEIQAGCGQLRGRGAKLHRKAVKAV